MVRIKRMTDVLYNISVTEGKIPDLKHHKSLQEKDIRVENITELELGCTKNIYIFQMSTLGVSLISWVSLLSLVTKDENK